MHSKTFVAFISNFMIIDEYQNMSEDIKLTNKMQKLNSFSLK